VGEWNAEGTNKLQGTCLHVVCTPQQNATIILFVLTQSHLCVLCTLEDEDFGILLQALECTYTYVHVCNLSLIFVVRWPF